MKVQDSGVKDHSSIHFLSPTKFSKETLLFCPQYGWFACDNRYFIKRDSLDLFLICYIEKGSLEFVTNGQTFLASENSVVLLDCRSPHVYSCPETAEFMWVHFSGRSVPNYVDYLIEKNDHSIVFQKQDPTELRHHIRTILNLKNKSVINEHQLSITLHSILARLDTTEERTENLTEDHPIVEALAYIREHYAEPISTQELADMTHLSRYHFIRVFKRYTNSTPHEYLTRYRLVQAKQLLHSTMLTNEEIAFQCGFNSASHFARAFRHHHELSPQQFRKVIF